MWQNDQFGVEAAKMMAPMPPAAMVGGFVFASNLT
jgi:hypothetical protein